MECRVKKVEKLVQKFLMTTGTGIKVETFCKENGLNTKEEMLFKELVILEAITKVEMMEVGKVYTLMK